jgi:hypothetical protein
VSLARPLLKLLFFHSPRVLFHVAGLVRAINRGKRAFRSSLKAGGLPEEVIDALMEEFDPLRGVGLRNLLGFSRDSPHPRSGWESRSIGTRRRGSVD